MSQKPEYLDLQFINDRTASLDNLGWDLDTIKQSTVMVVGAGAIGNEVLKNLALIGVGNILIVDFDVIERTNLAKSVLYRESDCTGDKRKAQIAAERIQEINPDIRLMTINGDLTIDVGLGVFRRMNTIIGCVDNRLTRMWINRFCYWLDKTWIDGGIMDLGGQVDVYQRDTTCYECGLSPKAIQNIHFRNGCINRAMRYASAGLANTNSIVSSIVGAVQVLEALKVIVGAEHSLAGTQFTFNGVSNYYDTLPNARTHRKDCRSQRRIENIIEAPLSNKMSVKDCMTWLENYFQDNDLAIDLYQPLALSLQTEKSGKRIPFVKPRPHITRKDLEAFREIDGEDVQISDWTEEIDKDFLYPNKSLRELGIPPLQIISVLTKGERVFVELSEDKDYLAFK